MKKTMENVLPTSEKYLLKGYIEKQLQKEMGKEEFSNLHYLMKDKLMEEYEEEHWEELREKFPNVSLL